MPDDSQVSIAKARRPGQKANRMCSGPAEGLAHAGLPEADRSPLENRRTALDPEVLVPALRSDLAPLQAMLEREIADRRTLQHQADDLRNQLAASQLATAEATREATVGHALRVSAEPRIKDPQATATPSPDLPPSPPPPHSCWLPL